MRKFFLLLLLTISCQQKPNDLKHLNFKYIYQKIQVLDIKSLLQEDEKIFVIQNKKFQVENKVIYNSNGQAIEIFVGGSEGFITYSRDSIRGKLPFDKEMQNIKISLNKAENYIFDNNDTIREFEIIENEKILKCKKRNDGRTIFYKYK
jgi:hypothetical protein